MLSLAVLRQRAQTFEHLAPEAHVSSGDNVTFEVSLARPRFVGIFAIDANAQVSAWFPPTGALVKVPAGQNQRLDRVVTLDKAVGPTNILLLACDRPLSAAALIRDLSHAVRKAQDDIRALHNMHAGCEQASFFIRRLPCCGP